MLRNYRKPLVIPTPKIGLKHPKAVSPIEEFANGNTFKPIYVNEFGKNDSKKVIFCSGKVFFDIQAKLEENKSLGHKVTVIRVEELAPFPIKLIENAIKSVNTGAQVYWVQEEPTNEGAF
jgi:2-oxoglutarate dehydrogenase E1 component